MDVFRISPSRLALPVWASLVLLGAAACDDSPPGQSTRVSSIQRGLSPPGLVSRSAAGCGNVSFEGCCDGNTVWYCKSKKLHVLSCAKSPKCGWSTTYNLHDCGTSGKADPAGKHPLSCGPLFGDGGPPTDGQTADLSTQEGGAVTDSSLQETAPPADSAPPADIVVMGDGGGCGGVTPQGCCDGNTLWFCELGKLKKIGCAFNLKCGWDAKQAVYDCGTPGGTDPAAKHPRSCSKLTDAGLPSSDAAPDSVASTDSGPGCGTLTIQGCCDGETVWYCSAGKVQHYSCATQPQCGWSSLAKWYYCKTNGGADPSGKYPRSCHGLAWDGGPPITDAGPPEMGPDMPLPDLLLDIKQSDLAADRGPELSADLPRPDRARADVTANPGDESEEGCSCQVNAAQPPWATLLLMALLLRRGRGRSKKTKKTRVASGLEDALDLQAACRDDACVTRAMHASPLQPTLERFP